MTLEEELLQANNADAWYHKGVRGAKIQTENGRVTISERQLAKLQGIVSVGLIPPDRLKTISVKEMHTIMTDGGWVLTSIASDFDRGEDS